MKFSGSKSQLFDVCHLRLLILAFDEGKRQPIGHLRGNSQMTDVQCQISNDSLFLESATSALAGRRCLFIGDP